MSPLSTALVDVQLSIIVTNFLSWRSESQHYIYRLYLILSNLFRLKIVQFKGGCLCFFRFFLPFPLVRADSASRRWGLKRQELKLRVSDRGVTQYQDTDVIFLTLKHIKFSSSKILLIVRFTIGLLISAMTGFPHSLTHLVKCHLC